MTLQCELYQLGKGKSPRKLTPKKSATKNGIVAAAADQMNAVNVSPPVPNLRLEAKLRAQVSKIINASYTPLDKVKHLTKFWCDLWA